MEKITEHPTDLLSRLKEQSEWHNDGHGPLHKEAANEIERLRVALSFYATDENWFPEESADDDLGCEIVNDRGQIARKALADSE